MATTVTIVSPFSMSNHVARRNSDSEDKPSSFTPVNVKGERLHMNGQNEDSSPSDISPNGESNTGPSTANHSPSNSPQLRQKNGHSVTNGGHNTSDRTSSPLNESIEQAHKRKRSLSTDANGYPAHARYDYSPPKRAEPQHMAEGALQALGDTDRPTQPQHASQTNGVQNGRHNHNQSWQAVPGQYGHQQNGGPMNLSEAHLATALQQATQQEAGTPQNLRTARETSSADGYGQDQTGSGQSGNKRKRQFSNRTKTGCRTCRNRKKKCDEGQPTCQNCQRGGFECMGYSNNSTFTRPGSYGKSPIPLQSKDGGYVDVVDANGYPVNNSPPGSKRSVMPSEISQSRALTIEDGDGHGQYTASPQSAEPRVRSVYGGQAWPQNGPYPGQPNHGPDRLPSFSALSKVEGQKQDYVHPQQHYRPPPQNMSQQQQQPQGPPPPPQGAPQWHAAPPPPLQQRQDYRQYPPQLETSHPPPPPHHQRMSSTYDPVKSGPRAFTAEEVEKSKMLRGANFNYFDPTLTNERQRCEVALKRYNDASQLSSGLNDAEKLKLLEKVVDPNKDHTHNFIVPCTDNYGTLGSNVKIEAPFTASYGYNLKIHDEVCIHHHCNIDDAALVDIGHRTWIGPNVTILTTDVRSQMQDRKGVTGSWLAQPVKIDQEVYIGANVTIYPGVTIGRGATVCHGAIVTESLQDNEMLKANGVRCFQ